MSLGCRPSATRRSWRDGAYGSQAIAGGPPDRRRLLDISSPNGQDFYTNRRKNGGLRGDADTDPRCPPGKVRSSGGLQQRRLFRLPEFRPAALRGAVAPARLLLLGMPHLDHPHAPVGHRRGRRVLLLLPMAGEDDRPVHGHRAQRAAQGRDARRSAQDRGRAGEGFPDGPRGGQAGQNPWCSPRKKSMPRSTRTPISRGRSMSRSRRTSSRGRSASR